MKDQSAQPSTELIKEFCAAPSEALFSPSTIAAVLHCSLAKLDRDRWAGAGIPFLKNGRSVLYRKRTVEKYLGGEFQSTAQNSEER